MAGGRERLPCKLMATKPLQLRDREVLMNHLLNTHNVHVLLPDVLYQLVSPAILAEPPMFQQSIFIGKH